MSISIWWTGKTTPDYLNRGVEDYIKRIQHFHKVAIKEFKEFKGLQSAQKIITYEEKELNIQLHKSKYYIVLLDEKGSAFNSLDFSKWLDNKLITSSKVCFIIGGAYGFSNDFKEQANELVSFSKMTLSHQLIRLIFMEQLYRAFTIIHNLPYHHD